MDRFGDLARRYGFDVLIVLAAIEGALEVALRDDSPCERRSTPLWFAVPAVVLVVLPLLARRRFPFAAPASLWVLAAALSFVDGRLVVFASGVYIAGLVAAFLLGNLRDVVQARIGLARRRASAAIVVYNDPNRTASEFVFVPAVVRRSPGSPASRCASGPRRPRRRKSARPTPSASARRRPASRSPRSARGSRASSTTSSPTPSA